MKISVLNPNSLTRVTQSMERCLAPLASVTAHRIDCVTLEKGPPGIETDAHVAEVAPHVVDFVTGSDADAIVIACFSDPAVPLARAATPRPVFGIAESAYVGALLHGTRFGVISLGQSSVARHRRKISELGLLSRLAGDRSIDMGVAEANDLDRSSAVIGRIARELIDEDGAEVLILGCAGMGEQRQRLQDRIGVVVIDPVQAAVANAITALDLGYGKGARNV